MDDVTISDSQFVVSSFLKEHEATTMYIDKKYPGTTDDYYQEILTSGTIYVGNLDPTTREEQVHLLYSQCGEVRRVIMGLDANRHVPCGFCFVEFKDPAMPVLARRYFAEYRVDRKHMNIDLDTGFSENRQFGRGKTGRQVWEDYSAERKRRRVG